MVWTRFAAFSALSLALLPAPCRGQYDCGMFVDPLAFPQQGMAKVEGQFVQIEHSISKQVYYVQKQPVTENITVEVDGKQETRAVTKYVEVTKCKQVTAMERMAFPTQSIQYWDTSGEKVDAEKAQKRLEAGDTVLFANRKVPTYYLSVFKPETLVLQGSPQPMAVPAPITATPPPAVGPMPIAPPGPVPVPRIAPPAAAPAAPAPRPVPATAPPVEAPVATPAVAAPFIGPCPTVKLAALAKNGIGLRTYVKNVSTNTGMLEKVDGEGNKIMMPFSFETESIQDIELRYPLAALKIMTAEGKEVAEVDLPKLLEKPRCVLVSADGQPVSKVWLKIVRPEALIVVPPPAPPPIAIPAPAPALGPPGPAPAPTPSRT